MGLMGECGAEQVDQEGRAKVTLGFNKKGYSSLCYFDILPKRPKNFSELIKYKFALRKLFGDWSPFKPNMRYSSDVFFDDQLRAWRPVYRVEASLGG